MRITAPLVVASLAIAAYPRSRRAADLPATPPAIARDTCPTDSASPANRPVSIHITAFPTVDLTGLGSHGALVGAVYDTPGRPIEDARVWLYRTGDSTRKRIAVARTGSDGLFRIDSLGPGRYMLRSLRLGFSSVEFTIRIRQHAVDTAIVRLGCSSLRLGPITTN